MCSAILNQKVEPFSLTEEKTENKKYPYIVGFDVETEGLDNTKHAIIELGAIKIDVWGKVIDTFSMFGNPGRNLSDKIIEITGITDEMLKDAKPSSEIVVDWINWLGSNCILVAHNAPFDVGFVTYSLQKQNIDFEDYFVVDTLEWSRQCFKNLQRHKLGILLEYIGHPSENLHRAFDDAKGAVTLAASMMRQMHHPQLPEDIISAFRLYGRSMKQYISKNNANYIHHFKF